ncbi:hypothetical protein AB0H12_13650 [Actinosynnema sp. NPDC023794]
MRSPPLITGSGHRTLIRNQRRLLQAPHEYERFHRTRRSHQGAVNARPLPRPASSMSTTTPPDLRGR